MQSEFESHAARLGHAFLLDGVKVLVDSFQGDLVTGLVFLAILCESEGLEQIAELEGAAEQSGADSPVTVYSIAKRLGFTYETARRHVNRLIQDGYCTRCESGLVVVNDARAKPNLARGHERHLRRLERLQRDLYLAGSHHPTLRQQSRDRA